MKNRTVRQIRTPAMSLIVDVLKPGYGIINDRYTGRRSFPKTSAKVTQIDANLIVRFGLF